MNTSISDSNTNSSFSFRIWHDHKCDRTNDDTNTKSIQTWPDPTGTRIRNKASNSNMNKFEKYHSSFSPLLLFIQSRIFSCALLCALMTSISGVAQFALVKYQPAIEWFMRKFYVELHNRLSAFKRCKHVSANYAVAEASTCKIGGSTPVSVLWQ